MKLTYQGKTYECVSVEKKAHEIIIRTGKVEDDEEIVYRIYGDIDFNAVVLDGGNWTDPPPTDSDRLAELEEALYLFLSGVTE